MLERLFTYGSLQPGGQYVHLLAPAGADWQPATATGFVEANGWGHSIGYPALIIHADGKPVHGQLLSSYTLHELWSLLDEFEGEAYQRTITTVSLADGSEVAAYVYTLHSTLQPAILRQLEISK